MDGADRPTDHIILCCCCCYRRDGEINAYLLLSLAELVLKMTDSQIRELLLWHLPPVLGYLLVETSLIRESTARESPTQSTIVRPKGSIINTKYYIL